MNAPVTMTPNTRERLIHALYEAAELEHNLMCTYLYAAFSLKDGTEEGLTQEEAAAVESWRRAILGVAVDEMGHLTAVWNITSALGGSPRFGRANFPLDPGMLARGRRRQAGAVSTKKCCSISSISNARTARRSATAKASSRSCIFARGIDKPRITPMPMDYDTVGEFYQALEARLRDFVARIGEADAFCGDPASSSRTTKSSSMAREPVICIKTASAALKPSSSKAKAPSKLGGLAFSALYRRARGVCGAESREPQFRARPSRRGNPLLRRAGASARRRVWIEDEEAAEPSMSPTPAIR